jgi:hypothetical protein
MQEENTVTEAVKPSKREVILLLKQEIEALKATLAKQVEETKKFEGYYKMYQDNASKADATVEEMHCLLDTLPGVVGRKTSEDYYSKPYSLSARFCSWLATRIN